MLNLDMNEQNILSITEDTEIMLKVHGESNFYKPIKHNDGSWDIEMVYTKNKYYGLSCENINELRALLLADYATNIITKAFI